MYCSLISLLYDWHINFEDKSFIYWHFCIQSFHIDMTILNICDHFDTVVDLLDVTSVWDDGKNGNPQDCTFVSKHSFQDVGLQRFTDIFLFSPFT